MAAWDPQPSVPVKELKSPQRRYSLHGRNSKQLPKSRGAGADELCSADGPELLGASCGKVEGSYLYSAERGDELCPSSTSTLPMSQLYGKSWQPITAMCPARCCWSRRPLTCLLRKNRPCWIMCPAGKFVCAGDRDFGGNTVVLRAVPAGRNRRTPKACSLRSPTSCSRAATTH